MLCLTMVSCSGSTDDNSTDLRRRTNVDSTVADAAEKRQEALRGAKSETAADGVPGTYHEEAVRLGAAYVTADRLHVRLAPSLYADVIGVLHGGQKVEILEMYEGWSRISRYYDGSAEEDSGRVARWVASAYLSQTGPGHDAAQVSPASPLGRAIDRSDDSHVHRSSFLMAARRLVERGQCTVSDFEKIGGWVQSFSHGASVYFTYCGGLLANNRIYLDVNSGRIFR